MAMTDEVKEHLLTKIIPFWKKLRDEEFGGYYGWLDYDLQLDKKSVKGCILNSRITWFFANAYMLLEDESLLEEARHGFAFIKERCMDQEYGGIYWSVKYDGSPEDTTKHTYNQAFCIYALASYYEASKDAEALAMAESLFELVEGRCRDEEGYLEAFTREFVPKSNEKLSENGVIAERTMNTLLHVFEAYTELYRVSGSQKVKKCLIWMTELAAKKIYNPRLHRQEVFLDRDYHSLLDLHSYGHDIEAAWLLDRGLAALDEPECTKLLSPVTKDLTAQIYQTAYDGRSLANECEAGVVNGHRVWWVQAEAIVGFLNGYQKEEKEEYFEAAKKIWGFIQEYLVDKRSGSEWFWEVDAEGKPYEGRPIVEPWKCPYHNGRMCFEVIRRLGE